MRTSTSLHAGWLDLQSNPYAWVCLRIWPDNLILSVAAGGDVVWSSFSAGIFYHMERLENKQYIVHVQPGTPKVSCLAPPTASFSNSTCSFVRRLCCALHYCHIKRSNYYRNFSKISGTQYIYSMASQKCHYLAPPIACFFDSHPALLDSLVGHYIIVKWKF